MGDSQPIVIKSHTLQPEIDRAYQSMCDTYRDLVIGYCGHHRVRLSEVIENSGCPNPELIHRFVLGSVMAATGKDLERLLSHVGLVQTFAEEVPITIGSEVNYWGAMCGTTIHNEAPWHNEVDEETTAHKAGTEVPGEFDKIAKRVLSRTTWFYLESTKRYLR